MTVGHAIVLQRLGSPFAIGSNRVDQIGSGDIALLVWVCSTTWRRAWRRRESFIGRAWRSWFAGRVRPALPFYQAIAGSYVLRAWKGPKPRGLEGVPPLGAPALGILLVALMADLGFSRESAMDTTIGEALWLAAIQSERSGAVMFDSEEGISVTEIAQAQVRMEAEAREGVGRGD